MAALVPTQHPAAASCKALAVAERWPNGKFSPRAPVQFLHLRLIPHFHPMNCTSWGHNPGLPVKLSTFRYFLLASLCSIFFFFFSFANESTISLPWPGKSASAPQQTFALALKLLTSRQLGPPHHASQKRDCPHERGNAVLCQRTSEILLQSTTKLFLCCPPFPN